MKNTRRSTFIRHVNGWNSLNFSIQHCHSCEFKFILRDKLKWQQHSLQMDLSKPVWDQFQFQIKWTYVSQSKWALIYCWTNSSRQFSEKMPLNIWHIKFKYFSNYIFLFQSQYNRLSTSRTEAAFGQLILLLFISEYNLSNPALYFSYFTASPILVFQVFS